MEIKHGVNTFDPQKAVKPIIEILHEEGIPISGIRQVFELVIKDAITHTAPYSPKEYKQTLETKRNG